MELEFLKLELPLETQPSEPRVHFQMRLHNKIVSFEVTQWNYLWKSNKYIANIPQAQDPSQGRERR